MYNKREATQEELYNSQMFSRLRIFGSSENTILCIHFLNQPIPENGPFLTLSKFQVVNEKHIIYLYVTKKKESIDIQIKYFFPVYINALLNKLFIDNKRHHACIIPFLFLPQLCNMLCFNTVDIFLCTMFIFRRS